VCAILIRQIFSLLALAAGGASRRKGPLPGGGETPRGGGVATSSNDDCEGGVTQCLASSFSPIIHVTLECSMEVPPGTLQHRTAFADENQRAGRCASERAGRLWLIDPHAASELLKEYDGGTGHIVKDDTKRTGLLKSSLTQSDGPDWRRQRAAVVAAVGGGQVAQFTRHRAAACRAGELAASVIADHTARSPQRVMVHPDVMDLARMVAARGIVAAVVGDGDGDANAAAEAARIEVVLSAFMKVSSAAPSLSLSFPLISSHFLSFSSHPPTRPTDGARSRKTKRWCSRWGASCSGASSRSSSITANTNQARHQPPRRSSPASCHALSCPKRKSSATQTAASSPA